MRHACVSQSPPSFVSCISPKIKIKERLKAHQTHHVLIAKREKKRTRTSPRISIRLLEHERLVHGMVAEVVPPVSVAVVDLAVLGGEVRVEEVGGFEVVGAVDGAGVAERERPVV